MDRLKIGIMTSAFSQNGLLGGITKTVRLIARYMTKKGHDVTVFTFRFPGTTSIEYLDGFTVRRFKYMEILGEWCYSKEMYDCVRNQAFDLIHSFHYGYYPATVGYKTAKKQKLPHLFSTSYHPFHSTKTKSLLAYLYRKTQGEVILKNSAVVLPQNITERNELFRVVKRKYEILPIPIDQEIFHPYKVKKTKNKVALYVGGMVKNKADIAFKICENIENTCKDVRFVFIGNGHILGELKKRASKNFIFLKNLTDKELALQYNKADILLHPTQYESFSRVIAEACMCGLPSVSVNAGAVSETQLGSGRLVKWGAWDMMENEVLNLIRDDKERKRLSKVGMKKSKKYHSSVVNDKLYKIYKRLLA